MLTRPFRMLLPGVFMLLAAVASPAAAALHSPSAANVLFKAKTTVLMTVEGRSSDLSVSDDGTTVALKVPVKSLTTGIGLRDRHMRETLEADRFPNVELRVERKALVFPAANQEKSGNASGQL